eukprot:2032037-Pyramimonas_sp.AAC.1
MTHVPRLAFSDSIACTSARTACRPQSTRASAVHRSALRNDVGHNDIFYRNAANLLATPRG